MEEPLLMIKDLSTYFFTREGIVKAVDKVSLKINRGEVVGLVGESGCGKSTTALSILRLIPFPGKIVGGKIIFDDEDLLEKSEEEMRRVRGDRISMIFQDPASSLNPVFEVGGQINEAITSHIKIDKSEGIKKTIDILERVGIPDASKRRKAYPHEFSAGMKQRAMIAMALICEPDLLIADEPTSNLDVTIQAQIIELMRRLKEDIGSSILLITHNLALVTDIANKIGIMYAGKIVEFASTEAIYEKPRHPYTRALLYSIPSLDVTVERLGVIPGEVPNLVTPPTGCRFHPRCKYSTELCSKEEPTMTEIERGHLVSCLRAHEIQEKGRWRCQTI